jgi:hypothetical protein
MISPNTIQIKTLVALNRIGLFVFLLKFLELSRFVLGFIGFKGKSNYIVLIFFLLYI